MVTAPDGSIRFRVGVNRPRQPGAVGDPPAEISNTAVPAAALTDLTIEVAIGLAEQMRHLLSLIGGLFDTSGTVKG